MEPCYPVDCGHYTVAPMLVPAQCMRKYCEAQPICSKPVCYRPIPKNYDCCKSPPQKDCCTPPPTRRSKSPPQPNCPEPCCYYNPPPCKTKYIMPCYRYEDGRIANQPTVLMRRACEVACGTRKRKPFVVSSYAADPHNEIRRYHSEDDSGNCCFHFERKKPPQCEPCWAPGSCCQPCCPYQACAPCEVQSCPECQYVECVYAHP